MNQKQINAFRMVMRHGSITAAAHALNVSQPAVSRLIADLESSIGFPLLLRPGGKVQPTPEAYDFFAEVERMFYGLERLSQVAADIRTMQRATFRIASMPMVSFEIIPRTVKRFIDRHPGVGLTHDVHTSARILDLLASRQIDLGVAQTSPERQDVDVLASFRTDCVCVMAPDHPLAGRAVLTPQDLADEPLVALNFRTITYGYMTQCFAQAGVSPRVVAETQPSYSACGLAALGTGIALVDPITPGIFGAALRSVPFAPEIPFEYQIMKPADLPLSRAAMEFFEELLAAIALRPQYGRRIS
ncbi:LysR substrate-binding domain-containing protein [Tropicimonas sp. IMCC6043]|uniref:LysR substrate-binding domain-containing protein n=1 Tax=Tropicimonas sp. IMCC6043 TaxID=2510645 RepID=UPI00101CFE22|nr:LysR substrate-binding domain-containing protein [Tropicimonas sp. IMCC6043]RYH11358.1 LysR family transcriptional regulator [Tropicimonas sp. IMCC6043]